MYQKISWLLSTLLLTSHFSCCLSADAPKEQSVAFTPFTGKITRNKVRLRQQPNLDGKIIKELARNDLLVIVGEDNEYYLVQAPRGSKAYVFRTFVLDNTIEGNRVNVRLEPDTESPVIAQLNQGDKVDGVVSSLNSKWLEISPPSTTRFFVCKEYVENVGAASLIFTLEKRQEEVNSLLNSTNLISQSELQKPFEEIKLDLIVDNLNKIIKLYADFPDQVARAKEILTRIQDTYTQKKIAYLEAKTAHLENNSKQLELSTQLRNQQNQFDRLEKTLDNTPTYASIAPERAEKKVNGSETNNPSISTPDWSQAFYPDGKTEKMISWIATEKELYESWLSIHEGASPSDYYSDEFQDSVALRGKIESYPVAVKNKPGDYILVSIGSNLPIAYLYSTFVDLQEMAGKEITMHVIPRSNNHFAFPAYFVLTAE